METSFPELLIRDHFRTARERGRSKRSIHSEGQRKNRKKDNGKKQKERGSNSMTKKYRFCDNCSITLHKQTRLWYPGLKASFRLTHKEEGRIERGKRRAIECVSFILKRSVPLTFLSPLFLCLFHAFAPFSCLSLSLRLRNEKGWKSLDILPRNFAANGRVPGEKRRGTSPRWLSNVRSSVV